MEKGLLNQEVEKEESPKIDGALGELASVFQEITGQGPEPEKLKALEPIPIPLPEEPEPIVPYIDPPESYDVRAASKELRDLFGIMAGVEIPQDEEEVITEVVEEKQVTDSLEDAIANILGAFKEEVEEIAVTEEVIVEEDIKLLPVDVVEEVITPTIKSEEIKERITSASFVSQLEQAAKDTKYSVAVVEEVVEKTVPSVVVAAEVVITPTIKSKEIKEQITSASFVSQLEQAAKDTKTFTGSVENAITDLSALFQDTYEIPITQTAEEKEKISIAQVIEATAQDAKVIDDITGLLEKHKEDLPEEQFQILKTDSADKTVEYLNKLNLKEFEVSNSMPLTGANDPIVSSPMFTTAVTGILRKMMATGPGTGVVELTELDDIDPDTLTDGYVLAYKPNVAPINLPFKWIDATQIGDITKITAGAGLTGGGDAGDVTLAIRSELGVTASEITPSVHVVPAIDNTVDLGTSAKRFKKLYLAQDSIDLGGAIISSDGSGTISIAATGAVLPVGSRVGTDAIGTANTVTGVSTRNVPFFTRAGGSSTAAATYVFKGSGADDIEFENFFFSNGTNIMDTQTFAQFVF